MTSPIAANKTARFEDKMEIFQYTDTKDDDWLLASPCETQPDNRIKDTQKEREVLEITKPILFNKEPQPPPPPILDPEIEKLKRMYENMKTKGPDHHEDKAKEKEREEDARRVKQEEEKRKAKEEEQKRQQEQLRLQAQNQIKREREERARIQQQEKQKLEALQQKKVEIALATDQPSLPPPVAAKSRDRVTLNVAEWLKLTTGQSIAPSISADQPAPIIKQGRTSVRGNRITLDLKSISSLFEDNFNKYQSLSNKSRQTMSRKSISYRNSNTNPNALAFEQYFQSLEAEPNENELAEEKYFAEMEQQSQKRLKESQNRISKLQEELKYLQAELASLPDDSQASVADISRLESHFQPVKYLHYNFRIELLQFDVAEDPFAVYCEFILDNNLFCKLRRDDRSHPAELLMTYNTFLDSFPGDALIDMQSKIELLRLYFSARLDRLPTFQLLEQMGLFYNEFSELEEDLARCCSIFNIQSMELSRSCDKLSFELSMKPKATVLVTLHLLQLTEACYYEFYHIEASRVILLPQERLGGDDLIDILEAMSDCL